MAGFDEKVLTRINVPTGLVVQKIPVGIEPAAVVAGPGGVWVANSGDNTIQHVDPETEKVDPAIRVGDGPDALALDGTTLWVANGRAGTPHPDRHEHRPADGVRHPRRCRACFARGDPDRRLGGQRAQSVGIAGVAVVGAGAADRRRGRPVLVGRARRTGVGDEPFRRFGVPD
ncbi:MAG: hypothetical protein ABJA74_03060 [Lapillicoccus sp.]